MSFAPHTDYCPPSGAYYFLHIPKTAGTSVHAYLEGQFSPTEVCPARLWSELLAIPPASRRCYKLYSGHFYVYLNSFLQVPLRYLTFLRDPIERALSHYGHVLRDPDHYFHHKAHTAGGLEAYLRDPAMQRTVSDFQARSLVARFRPRQLVAGMGRPARSKRNLEMLLETADARIPKNELLSYACMRLQEFCFVGITERLTESLSLLSTTVGWPSPIGEFCLNCNNARTRRQQLAQHELDLLLELNQVDLALYDFALKTFADKLARA